MCVCVCASGLSVQPRRDMCRARVRKGAKRRSWPGDVGGGAERAFGSGPLWCGGFVGPACRSYALLGAEARGAYHQRAFVPACLTLGNSRPLLCSRGMLITSLRVFLW